MVQPVIIVLEIDIKESSGRPVVEPAPVMEQSLVVTISKIVGQPPIPAPQNARKIIPTPVRPGSVVLIIAIPMLLRVITVQEVV